MATRQRAVATRKATPVARPPNNILGIIADAAADESVQPEKMRALLDMQKEIMAEEARIAFTKDFIAMMEELPTINATGRIEIRERVAGQRTGPIQQSTAYATYNEIWRTIKPILLKHHFGLTHSNIESSDGRVVVKTTLIHERGHQRESIIPLPLETSGSKNNVQAYGSSTSYAKRYNTAQLLNLISDTKEDRDTDGVTTIDQSQLEELIILADDFGVDKRRFCEHFKIPAMIDLPIARLDEAKGMIRKKGKK
jgi:hypothetical protein